MPFASECLEIAPACEEQMLGREGLPLLGEAGIFLTGLSRVRDHYLIRRNCPEFHILMMSHDEGARCSPTRGASHSGRVADFPARRRARWAQADWRKLADQLDFAR